MRCSPLFVCAILLSMLSLTYGRYFMGGTPAHPSPWKPNFLMDVKANLPNQVMKVTSSLSTPCKPTYGVLPCTNSIIGGIFLLAIYGYIIFTAARFLAQGSELLLLVLDTGIVGGLLLPIFGVLPDSILVLVSGIGGSKAEAQEEVLVGIGIIAGSNVMLLTLLWGTCLILGRCDLEKASNGKFHAMDKRVTKRFDLLGTGVEIDKTTRVSAGIMCASIIPFLVVQLPHIFHASPTKRGVVITACLMSLGALLVYCTYQVMAPSLKRRKKLRALYNLITFNVLKFSSGGGEEKLVGKDGNVNEAVLKRVFDRLDHDKDGKLTRDEVRVMLTVTSFEEKLNETLVDSFMTKFDTNNSNTISWEEFLDGMKECCRKAKPPPHTYSNLELFKMGEYLSTIEDLVESQREAIPLTRPQIIKKSLTLLFLGTILISIFAEPLVDAVTDFSHASHIPSFFVSFVLLPIASNASESISSIIFASHKQKINISLTYSQIYGAVTMNNTMSLGILLAIIYARRLEWDFSSEVLIICLVTLVMGIVGLSKTIIPLWVASLALLLYPLSIALVAILDYVAGWR